MSACHARLRPERPAGKRPPSPQHPQAVGRPHTERGRLPPARAPFPSPPGRAVPPRPPHRCGQPPAHGSGGAVPPRPLFPRPASPEPPPALTWRRRPPLCWPPPSPPPPSPSAGKQRPVAQRHCRDAPLPPPLPPGRARTGRALNGAGRAPGAAPDRIRESLGLEKSCEIVWCNHHPTTDVTH